MANNKKNGNHKPKMKYEIHPAADLIPPIPPEEFRQLVADIQERGLREPILMQGSMLLDGRHRMKACEELGIKPVLVQYTGKDVVGEILSRNIYRRHLTDDQRVTAVALARAPQLIAEAEARKKAGVAIPDNVKSSDGSKIGKETADIIGSEAKTSQYKARQAVDLVTHAPKKAKAVIAGKHPLAEAAREARRVKTEKAVKKGKGKVVVKIKAKPDKTSDTYVIKRLQKFLVHWTPSEQRKVRPIIAEFCKK